MKEYATQMEAARKGIITEELKIVAEKSCRQWRNYCDTIPFRRKLISECPPMI